MEKYQSQLTESILNITLEIIFLLTGEEYGPMGKSDENLMPISNPHKSGGCSSTQHPIEGPPADSLTHDRSNEQRILDLINKITMLLTGEVPIRCQDVAVYFSMEECEYIEGHKDQYKDIIITSPDLSRAAYECEDFYPPLSVKNQQRFLAAMQEMRCPSVGKHSMPNQAISREAILLSSSIFPPTGHIIQGTPISFWGVSYEHEKEHRDFTDYIRHVFLDHTYSMAAKQKHQWVVDKYFADNGNPTPTNDPPYNLPSEYIEEPNLYGGESVTYSELPTPGGPIQYKAVQLEATDRMQEYQCTPIKVEPVSYAVSNPPDTDFHECTDLKQSPVHIKEEPVSYDSYENTAIYTPMYDTQKYTADHVKEEQPSGIDIYVPEETQYSNSSKAEIDVYLPTDTALTKNKDVHKKRAQQHKHLDKPFLCTECGKCFQCKSGLSTHKKIHMFRKRHTCPECGKSFVSHWYLLRHQKRHSGEKPYSCDECGKCFLKASNFNVHLKIHRKKGPFACDVCGKCFHKNSSLSQHQKVHQLKTPFTCSECNKWFPSQSELSEHRKLHSGEKTFSCPDCGKSFIKVQNLLNHQRLHTAKNPFSCIECGKLFTSNTYLIRHMAMHTRKETSYACSTCGKYFNSNLDLIIHQRIHSGEKSGTNSEWRKCFIRKLGFVIHQRNHAKPKSFSCPECKEQFAKKINLFHHRKIHREEKSTKS
ncbi:zinc finger protein 436-like [Dendropsophus ebraccatus]|uniref:zinc finger protein 436-like n=1 Tax=Dendropsophus ebraccatus TaxID=150705 RepID=UPI0038319EF7